MVDTGGGRPEQEAEGSSVMVVDTGGAAEQEAEGSSINHGAGYRRRAAEQEAEGSSFRRHRQQRESELEVR